MEEQFIKFSKLFNNLTNSKIYTKYSKCNFIDGRKIDAYERFVYMEKKGNPKIELSKIICFVDARIRLEYMKENR